MKKLIKLKIIVEEIISGKIPCQRVCFYRNILFLLEENINYLETWNYANKYKRIMVFMSSCNAVKFYSDLLNYVDMPVKDIHGK